MWTNEISKKYWSTQRLTKQSKKIKLIKRQRNRNLTINAVNN